MSASQWILFLSLSWTLHSRGVCTASSESVTKPVITYTCNDTTCTLSCNAENCSSYSWMGNGEVKENECTLMLEKSNNMGNMYVCLCSSSVTDMKCGPSLDKELLPEGSMKGWIAAAVIIPVIAVLVLAAVAYHCFVQKTIKATNTDVSDTSTTGEGVAKKQNIAPAVETRWNVAPETPALKHE